MSIGQRIKHRRIELGMSQEELAHKLGNKSRASVSTVEHDKEDLTTDRIRKYAEALETTPAYLMEWVDDPDWTPLASIPQEEQTGSIYPHINAIELYALYLAAPPEVQKIVDRILRPEEPHS